MVVGDGSRSTEVKGAVLGEREVTAFTGALCQATGDAWKFPNREICMFRGMGRERERDRQTDMTEKSTLPFSSCPTPSQAVIGQRQCRASSQDAQALVNVTKPPHR